MSPTPTHVAPSQEKEYLAWNPSDTGRRFLGDHASREAQLLLSLFTQSCPRALCGCRQSFSGFQRRIQSCLTFENVLLNFVNAKTYLLFTPSWICLIHSLSILLSSRHVHVSHSRLVTLTILPTFASSWIRSGLFPCWIQLSWYGAHSLTFSADTESNTQHIGDTRSNHDLLYLFPLQIVTAHHLISPLVAQPLSHLQPLICDSDRCLELFRESFFRHTSHACMCGQWLFTFLP